MENIFYLKIFNQEATNSIRFSVLLQNGPLHYTTFYLLN